MMSAEQFAEKARFGAGWAKEYPPKLHVMSKENAYALADAYAAHENAELRAERDTIRDAANGLADQLAELRAGYQEMREALDRAEEFAAKVRRYFTVSKTGECDIPEELDGDCDLYELASRITQKIRQPGKAVARAERVQSDKM